METRIQLNSKTYQVDVFKNMPSTELNKRYALKVERLTVPPMSGGLILNQPLFSVERRLIVNAEHSTFLVDGLYFEDDTKLPVEMVFTPYYVKNTSELVYQMNAFFRRLLLTNAIKTGAPATSFTETANQYAVPGEYDVDEKYDDWRDILDTPTGEPIEDSIQVIYRSDGKIGIKFSHIAKSMFVLKLTDEGKRILGWELDYVSVGPNNTFATNYLTVVVDPLVPDENHVTLALPAGTEDVLCVFNNSIFNHGHYRHEIVLRTSLPLRDYLECDHTKANYKNQLASYRYPSEPIRTEYDGTMFKVLKNVRRSRYMFEQSTKTHNEFLLTGSELQNFHVRLMQRNYTWDVELDKFDIRETPYLLPDESLWTVQLAVKPLQG